MSRRDEHRKDWFEVIDAAFALDDDHPHLSESIDDDAPPPPDPPKDLRAESAEALSLDWDESQHPRDDAGRFVDAGGGNSGGNSAAPPDHTVSVPPHDVGESRPTPIKVKTVSEAVLAILGGDVVEIQEVSTVYTVLEELAGMAKEAERLGNKAPNYDLCKVMVSGTTNLFCGDKVKTKDFPNGVPRIEMPQLSGQPVPGSKADSLPKVTKKNGETMVDAVPAFVQHLKDVEIGTKRERVPAAKLKATQAELIGPKVAGIMLAQGFDPGEEAIFVSRDDYVLDGHHRWAGVVGRDAKDGKLGDAQMNIIRVDAPISELLHRANTWSREFGIAPAGFKSLRWYVEKLRLIMLGEWDESLHPRDEAGRFTTGSGLSSGKVVNAKTIGGGHANAALIVDLDNGEKAVYKPEIGEAWDMAFANEDISDHVANRALSLAEREAMAYEVDQMIGTGLVPETILRTELPIGDVEASDDDGENYRPDDDELRGMYEDYREKAWERAADNAAEMMGGLYREAQDDHVKDINNRAEEVAEIWNDLIDENPEWDDVDKYGSRTEKAIHPTLPMGTEQGLPVQGFERAAVGGDVDPIEVLDEARVDPSSDLTDNERDRVRNVLAGKLRDGAQNLLDVDEDAAREHLDYGDWVEGHADTENRLIDQNIKSFDSWREGEGYGSDERPAKTEIPHRNSQAPHKQGGALQTFVKGLEERADLDWENGDHQKFAALDYVIGSMDRHGGNVFRDGMGKPLGLDNGYSFPDDNDIMFRSRPVTEWLGYGRHEEAARKVPEDLRTALSSNFEKADWPKFFERHKSMNDDEREAMQARIRDVREALKTEDGLYNLWRSKSTSGQVMR